MTHICVGKLTIIGSDNGLSPGRRQVIIWTSAGILLIVPLWTNFSEIWIEIITFSFKKMRLKVSSAKWRPFCLGLNVLTLNKMVAIDRWYFHNHFKKSVRERTVPFFYIHFRCCMMAQLIISIGSGNGMAPNKRQANTWTNDNSVYWRICMHPHVTIPADTQRNDNIITPKRRRFDVIKALLLSHVSAELNKYDNVACWSRQSHIHDSCSKMPLHTEEPI